MNRRAFIFGGISIAAARGQEVEFICPMDRNVRSPQPGRCPRCGMTLVPGIPDAVELVVSLSARPRAPRPGQRVELTFAVSDPKTRSRVTDFQPVHEKLYHMFVVSQDLEYFVHDHPRLQRDGRFRCDAVFPKPGMYRILSDFYPRHGTPQLCANTLIVPGGPIAPGAALQADMAPKRCANLTVSVSMEPAKPIAGMKTLLFFHLDPADGLEPYLGAWGHMLTAADDLIDMIHAHPFLGDGGPQVQFNVIFPRPAVYRLWVQFQRRGVVNTARFDVPVAVLG